MKYQIIVHTELESFTFTDNDGRTLFFPNKREAERFVDKLGDMFLYNVDPDSCSITIDPFNWKTWKYEPEDAEILIRFLMDVIENT